LASRRKNYQEDAKLRVMQLINQNPIITSREVAQKVEISNGSAYYLLTSLIDLGFVRMESFKQYSEKVKYSYILTPKGIREKSRLTNKFLIRKKLEFEALRQEINFFEESTDDGFNH
jgi:EPS-associated MarR family transcriptional regulator